MKTIQNTFALFVIALSFAACTEPVLEPAKPVHPSHPDSFRPDSTVTVPVRIVIEADSRPKADQPGPLGSGEQLGRNPYQIVAADNPEPVEGPYPTDVPRQTVVPVVKLDSLAQ